MLGSSTSGNVANLADLARDAIVFLSGRPEDLARFMTASGLAPQDLRARIQEPDFQLGMVEYLSQNEPLLLAFCEETGTNPLVFQQFGSDP